jgi:hypothetical protein
MTGPPKPVRPGKDLVDEKKLPVFLNGRKLRNYQVRVFLFVRGVGGSRGCGTALIELCSQNLQPPFDLHRCQPPLWPSGGVPLLDGLQLARGDPGDEVVAAQLPAGRRGEAASALSNLNFDSWGDACSSPTQPTNQPTNPANPPTNPTTHPPTHPTNPPRWASARPRSPSPSSRGCGSTARCGGPSWSSRRSRRSATGSARSRPGRTWWVLVVRLGGSLLCGVRAAAPCSAVCCLSLPRPSSFSPPTRPQIPPQNTVVYAGAKADRDIIWDTEFWHRGGASGQGDLK